MSTSPAQRFCQVVAPIAALILCLATAAPASAADQVYFSAVEDVGARLVERIYAETTRIDMSAWYLTDYRVKDALLNRHRAGIPVRLIGDRGSIFEIDQHTKNTFYELASQGVPIRLRFNPTWFPEIDHWKATIFAQQGIVAFGSPNYTPFELTPFSSTNYKDEVVLFTDDAAIVNAFKTKFDRYWNDTTPELESLIPTAPYFKNWDDACMNESACSDYRIQYPNPLPMVISTARLEPDNPLPSSIVWGQGPSFNNRLVTEIEAEQTAIDFVIYRLTVDNITQALLAKHQAGNVPIRLIIEPDEYGNRKWPEFWITHANIDKLWAAGINIKQRAHAGLTHMKVLITSNIATIASSNFAAAWQRDHNYFLPRTAKPTIHTAIKNRFQTMWNDQVGFVTFTPDPPDAPTPTIPAPGATNVPTTTTLTWDRAVFATSYDVYLGTSPWSMALVANVPAQLVNDPPLTYSYVPPSPLAPNTTFYWRVVSKTNATPRDPSMIASSSDHSFATASSAPPGGPIPSPWLTQDIGAVGQAGSATFATGTFTVRGAGADIWGNADALRYVYQGVNGDSEIVARVTSVQNTSPYAKAGVMLRQALTAGSAHVVLDVRSDGWVEFMTRSASGGSTTYVSGVSQPAPTWLKLSRSGNTVTGSVSSNGTTWTLVGTTTVSFGAAANLGLVVNSHDTAVLNTSTFESVTLTIGSNPPPQPPPGLPTPWTTQDIGATGLTGGASHSNGVFTVAGAGGDIWGTTDAFRYVSQTTPGDVQITARVAAIQNTNQWAKAGVMLRQSLTATSPHLILDVTPGGTIEFLTRAANGAETTVVSFGSQPVPVWLRLSRSGNTVTASVSVNGTTWTTVGSTTTSIPASANIGLAVTSHDVNTLNTSTFDNVTVGTPSNPPPPGLPTPWTTQDVGTTGLTGSASHSNGVFTVAGAGGDIWGTADAFRYVSQPTPGDVEIVTRVTAVQNTSPYAKAGVMLRQALTAGSAHVVLDVRPDGWVEFMTRSASGGSTTYLAGLSQPAPTWLKLSRSGNTVTGSVSSNGTTWTTVGSTTTSIPTSANIGLVVTSHDVNTLNTSTFANVTVGTPSNPPPQPPGLPTPWTTQDVGTTGLTGSASHSNGVFTVAGAGGDIWGPTDAFRYVSQTTSGDVQITAHVTAIQNTNQWAKAGLMLRQSLTATSPHLILDVTPSGTIEFLTRAANGAETTVVGFGSQPVPAWLRLSRSGSTVTASVSSNGTTWTTIGSTTTTIPASANIGLAVTSHDVNTLNTSTFDNVTVGTPSSPPPPPPTATNVVIYANDIPAAGRHGTWATASDSGSPSSVKLASPNASAPTVDTPLASPTNYVDVTFNAEAGTPYRIWLRLKALNNDKLNDAVWVQFSDSLFNGAPIYRTGTTSALLVNLATDGSASSLNNWGWQNGAYWLSQATTLTFQNSTPHTIRIQIREDGVQFDQIVLSPSTYLSSSPGSVTNDSVIVPKP